MSSPLTTTTRKSRASLSVLLAGLLVATAAATDIVLRSEAWVPVYALSLMPDSRWDFESDTISTTPAYTVRDNYLVLSGATRPVADDMLVSANDSAVE